MIYDSCSTSESILSKSSIRFSVGSGKDEIDAFLPTCTLNPCSGITDIKLCREECSFDMSSNKCVRNKCTRMQGEKTCLPGCVWFNSSQIDCVEGFVLFT
jgi:hypothetical protein